jgi:hypothetical protein
LKEKSKEIQANMAATDHVRERQKKSKTQTLWLEIEKTKKLANEKQEKKI